MMHDDAVTPGGGFLIGSPIEDVFTYEDLTADDHAVAAVAEGFVRREVLPRTDAIEALEPGVMRGLLQRAGELGLLMLDVSERHGGLGISKAASMLVGERAFKLASFCVAWGAHTGIGTFPLLFYGTAEQHARYLPRLMSGELIAAYALTEPAAGSDALGAKTRAVLTADGRHYRLTGQKQFITNGGFADLFTVFAKVDGEHVSAFLVERGWAGVSVGAEERKLGIKGSSTTQLLLDDVLVPKENLLGALGKGHKIAFNILNIGRFKLGAGVLGAARDCLEHAVRYAADRRQFQTPLTDFGAIQRKIADMTVRIWVAAAAGYRTAGLIDAALARLDATAPDHDAHVVRAIEEYTIEQSVVKVFGTETLDFVVDEALQMFGGYGFVADYPLERHYRDARITRIFEGTNEINRLLIPATLMKRVMTRGLPLLEYMREVEAELAADRQSDDGMRTAAGTNGHDAGDDGLARERRAVGRAKQLVAYTTNLLVQHEPADLARRQQHLERLADMIIDVYAMESALARAARAVRRQGVAATEFERDIVAVFVADAVERLGATARVLFGNDAEGPALAAHDDAIRRLTAHRPIGVLDARTRIAARVVGAAGVLP